MNERRANVRRHVITPKTAAKNRSTQLPAMNGVGDTALDSNHWVWTHGSREPRRPPHRPSRPAKSGQNTTGKRCHASSRKRRSKPASALRMLRDYLRASMRYSVRNRTACTLSAKLLPTS